MCPLLGDFKILKINFVIPEDRRFVSCKFDVNPYIHGGDPHDQKTADGRKAFQLYIVYIYMQGSSYSLDFPAYLLLYQL